MADIVERLRKDKWHVSGVDCETAAQEIERLQAEVTQLRQYLDTAQRRAAALGDEVAGMREDAERYRWLREQHESSDSEETMRVYQPTTGGDFSMPVSIEPGQLNAAIDAERKGTT